MKVRIRLKSNIQCDAYEQIRKQLKTDNTLSSIEIQQKFNVQGNNFAIVQLEIL